MKKIEKILFIELSRFDVNIREDFIKRMDCTINHSPRIGTKYEQFQSLAQHILFDSWQNVIKLKENFVIGTQGHELANSCYP